MKQDTWRASLQMEVPALGIAEEGIRGDVAAGPRLIPDAAYPVAAGVAVDVAAGQRNNAPRLATNRGSAQTECDDGAL